VTSASEREKLGRLAVHGSGDIKVVGVGLPVRWCPPARSGPGGQRRNPSAPIPGGPERRDAACAVVSCSSPRRFSALSTIARKASTRPCARSRPRAIPRWRSGSRAGVRSATEGGTHLRRPEHSAALMRIDQLRKRWSGRHCSWFMFEWPCGVERAVQPQGSLGGDSASKKADSRKVRDALARCR